ncbi:MAG: radical SAM protein [Candidatus Sumerlaeia bacterium]|nr:radical SAM protein [Candidatus Sumerlaeia bacterium]
MNYESYWQGKRMAVVERLIRLNKVDGLVAGVVFGPVFSRRFGRSLGINPLPPDRKLCTFDCPYCECGPTSQRDSRRLDSQPFPRADVVLEAVDRAIASLSAGGVPMQSLTLTGNGETTLHPEFDSILRGLRALRDRLLPAAQIVVLTNGTRLDRPAVRAGLECADRCVVKLDAGTEHVFQQINRPLEPVTLDAITEAASGIPRVIVQTLFVRGAVDNTADGEVRAWMDRIRRIAPRGVQIYSLDRRPAQAGLVAVPRADLEQIAERLRQQARLSVDVYGNED